MNSEEITLWAKLVASQQEVGIERVPIDRVIAAHLVTFQTLRATGLTWPSIAAILMRAGLRRKDGSAVTSDQLRADFSRLVLRQAKSSHQDATSLGTLSASLKPLKSNKASLSTSDMRKIVPPNSDLQPTIGPSDKSVSNIDISSAISRLTKGKN